MSLLFTSLNGDKDGKALYKWMANVVYVKTIENLWNRIDVKLVNNETQYLKWTSKPSYKSQKIFDNYLAAMRKTKVILRLNKPAFEDFSKDKKMFHFSNCSIKSKVLW